MILGHWEVRGAAQPIRNLLHYLSLPYSEVLYPNEDSWFNIAKPALKSDFPNLPYLIDGDKTITESQAIIVYLCLKANRTDLLGGTLEGEIDLVQLRSFWNDLRRQFYELACDKKEENLIEKLKEKVIPGFKLLSRHLGEKEWINGGLTVMDFVLAEGIEWVMLQEGDLLASMDNLKKLVQRVYDLPGVKEYNKGKSIPKYFLWENYANKKLRICY